jgi:hypothetical protein
MYDLLVAIIDTKFGWFTVGVTAGVAAGTLFGTILMASVKSGARYDRETKDMLDGFDYEPVARVSNNQVEYDFRSFK